MRVLHVIPSVAPRYGGPSSSIAEMCAALTRHGVDTLLATTDADGNGRLEVRTGTIVSWRGVDTIFFPRLWSEAFKYSPALARWLAAHVRDFHVVHIHAVLSHACLAAAAACRRARVPYVIRPLGTLDPWSLKQKGLRKRLMLSVAAARLVRGAAAVQYTSGEEKRGVEATLSLTHGVVIPLGVDPGLFEEPAAPYAARAADPYVLVLSRLHPVKNLQAFIEAFAAASEGFLGWRLVIAGSGDAGYVRSLEQTVERLGAGHRVTFAGWIDGAAKRELMRGASLFALPSHHENFGVSLVEALAAGVPALVSRHVHLAEIVERGAAGWVVDSDVESMRDGLRLAFADAAARDVRARCARELARQFAWPVVASDLVQLYGRVAVHSIAESPAALAVRS